jgi:GTP pyrophosphokinase
MNTINQAWLFAKQNHKGQVDDDGNPYFNHPCQVANILRMVTDNPNIIASAFLHDTVEDCGVTHEELCERFNKEIADLVMEVTHEGTNDNKGYYFPRLHSKEGIMIKFADRLSNLSRMDSWAIKRQEHYLKKSKFWNSEVK